MADYKHLGPRPLAPPYVAPLASSVPQAYVQARMNSAQQYANERVGELEQRARRDGCLRYVTPYIKQIAKPVQLSGVKTAQLFADRWATISRYIRHTLATWQTLNIIPLTDEEAYARLWTDIMSYRSKVVTLGRSLYRFINRYANDYVIRDELVFQRRLEEKDPLLTQTFSFRDRYLAGINEWLDRVKAVAAAIGSGAPISEAMLDFYLPWDARVWSAYFNPPLPNAAEQAQSETLKRYHQELYVEATNEDIDRTNEWFMNDEKQIDIPLSPASDEKEIIPLSPPSPLALRADIKMSQEDPIAAQGWSVRNVVITTPTEFWSATGFSPYSASRAKEVVNVCRGVFGTKDVSQFIQKYSKTYPGTTLRAVSIQDEKKNTTPIAFALLASRWMAGSVNHFVPARGEEKWIQRRVVGDSFVDVPLTLALDQPATTNIWEIVYVCASRHEARPGKLLIEWIIRNFGQNPGIPLVLEVAESTDRAKLVEYYGEMGFTQVRIEAQYQPEGRFQNWHTQIAGARARAVPLLMRYQK